MFSLNYMINTKLSSLHQRIFWLVTGSVAVVAVLLSAFFFVTVYTALHNHISENSHLILSYLSNNVALSLEQENYSMIVNLFDGVSKTGDLVNVWLLDQSKYVLISTDETATGLLFPLDIAKHAGFASLTLENQYTIAILSNDAVVDQVSRLLLLGIVIALAVLFTLLPYWIHRLTHSLTNPIHQASRAAVQMAYGNFDIHLTSSQIREIDTLVDSLANMSAQLKDLTNHLEQKVDERTIQLAQANQEISLLNSRLKTENIRMSAELDVTRRLQMMLLPSEDELKRISDLDIAGFMEPASEVGGDYYDVLCHNGRIKIGIGDVTGHGLESSVLMLMVQTAVYTLLTNEERNPIRFLNALNRTIYHNVQRMNSDKNLTLALLDYEDGYLWLSGQHEEILIVREDGNIELIDTMDLGFPIGLEQEISHYIDQAHLKLETGDVVVLYTDGITEAENTAHEHYGLNRLINAVKRSHQLDAHAIRQAVIHDLHRYIGQQKVYDDITLLVLKQR
ncbi:serine phosphatase RsbU, regulator of sigma subunit [Beggiatoa alba B18LD]|uniref:Serine phosphatase RsbU, regulator of sigma subunit n=2 Tax=Beggiatoa alba TaxID=1022 RepID=I3CK91_9GAMM|nr:serine phosphatase RsbU, regulator of sigma subunit [Beggiatoa alba B18LD]